MAKAQDEFPDFMAAPEETDTLVSGGMDAPPSIGSMGQMGGGQTSWRNFLCRSAHPIAAFFHLVFKATALFLYIFASLFGFDYILLFVVCVLLLAFDFWTVKNISGRLLVGLRWWIHIKEDGTNEWLFESAPNAAVSAIDSRVFWWSLYLAPVVWALIAFLNFLRFSPDYLLINLVAVALTGSNLWGYIKCSSDAQKRLQGALASGAMSAVSYIPGALPAIGSTMMNLLRTQAAAPAPAAAAGARTAAPYGASAPQGGPGAANPFEHDKVAI